jgi:hypothetical protein
MLCQRRWGVGRRVGDVWAAFHVMGLAKSRENSDFAMNINEINIELSQNLQRYINECCKSKSDRKIDGFGPGCCQCSRGSPLLCGVFAIC